MPHPLIGLLRSGPSRPPTGGVLRTLSLTESAVRKVGAISASRLAVPRRRLSLRVFDFGGARPPRLRDSRSGAPQVRWRPARKVMRRLATRSLRRVKDQSWVMRGHLGPVRARPSTARFAWFGGALKESRVETVNGSVDVAFAKASSYRYTSDRDGRSRGIRIPGRGEVDPWWRSAATTRPKTSCETVKGRSAQANDSQCPYRL